MNRSLDAEILSKAKDEGRIVLTCDLDFGDLLSASGECSPSVIIFRLENETPLNVVKRLNQVLQESPDALFFCLIRLCLAIFRMLPFTNTGQA
ncbi:MAG: DUF5615 family PIN-like protein [Candidatus Brocadia sp.]|nr:DUF5615 family PIN-like protein [Candidatus Brocadia sp.]